MSAVPRLENWSVVDTWAGLFLKGEVYGHPKPHIADGDKVTTSAVKSIDLDKSTAVTLRGPYSLGKRANAT